MAGLGLYIGDVFGSMPRDALPYETWGPPELIKFVNYYRGIVIGATTTILVCLAAVALRVLIQFGIVLSFASSIVHPIRELLITGGNVASVPSLYQIGGFQVAYFMGVLIVLGIAYVLVTLILPFVRQAKRR